MSGEGRVVSTADGVMVPRLLGPRPTQLRLREAGAGVVQRGVQHVRRLERTAGRRQQAERQVALVVTLIEGPLAMLAVELRHPLLRILVGEGVVVDVRRR